MKREKLYDNLINSGKVTEKEIGTREQFLTALSDPNKVLRFYQNITPVFSPQEIGTPQDFLYSVEEDFKPASPVKTFSEQELGLTSPQELKKQLPEQARQLSGILKDAPGYWDGEEGRDYATARNFLEDAQRMMTEAGEAKERNAVGNFFRSFGREITHPDTYSFGINSIDNAARLISISNKLEESGGDVEKLSHSEQALLQAVALRQAVEDLYSDDVSISQKAGSAVAQSLPFMVEFLATGGIGSGASAAARAGSTKLLNKLMRDGLLKRSLSAVTSQAMRQTARKGAQKAVPWVAERATRAAIMTPFQPTTYADIAERRAGRAGYIPNPEGGVSFDGITDRASFPEAVLKGMGSKMVANFTEMLGEGFGKGLDALTSQAGRKIPGLGRLMSKAEANGVYSRLSEGLKKSGWNGMLEEYMEEQAETVLNALFIGDSRVSDLWDREQQAVTALSVGALSGFFTAVNQGGGAIRRRALATDFRKADNALQGLGLSQEKLQQIRQGIGNLAPQDQVGFLQEFSLRNELNRDQQQAIINYAFQANRYYGMKGGIRDEIVEQAEQSAEKVREKVNPDMDAVVSARVAGYKEPVYIVGKEIRLTPQGQIDYQGSSSDVYIETPEGRRQVPVTMVEEIINHTPSEQAVEEERRRMRDELARQADAEIHGDMPLAPLQPGQTLSLAQGEAVVRSVDKGRYLIEMLDDHRQVEMTEGELQQALFGEGQAPVPQGPENSADGQTFGETQPTQVETQGETPGAGMETFGVNQEISGPASEILRGDTEIPGGNTETDRAGLQTQAGEIENSQPEGENSQTEPEFPKTPAGEIDYSGISDPAFYRQALESEFGQESLSVLEEMLAEAEAEMEKAEKKKSAIERARARRRAFLELEKLRQVEQLFTGSTQAEPALQTLSVDGEVETDATSVETPARVEEETPEPGMPATAESAVREEFLPEGQSRLSREESPGEGAELTHVEETPGPAETISSGESAERGITPYTVWETITEKWNEADKEIGREDVYIAPDGTRYPGRWVVAEAEDITPSHDPETLQPTPGFPVDRQGNSVNDNDYHNKRGEVESIAASYDSRALQDTPVVSQGIVVSGNNRTMSGQLAARRGTEVKYLEALAGVAQGKGIGDISRFGHPRLVFEVTAPVRYDTRTFSSFNQPVSKQKSPTERAIAISKSADGKVISNAGKTIDSFDTMSEFYSNRKAVGEVFNRLERSGLLSHNERLSLMDETGITAPGKSFLESFLLGSVLSEKTLRELNKPGMLAYKGKLTKAVIHLQKNLSLKNGYDLKGEINRAVDYLYRMRSGNLENVLELVSQRDLFTGKPEIFDNFALLICDMLQNQGERSFRDFIREYNLRAEIAASGQLTLSGERETKQDITKTFIDHAKSETARRAIRENNRQNGDLRTGPGGHTRGRSDRSDGGNIESQPGAEPENPGSGKEDGIDSDIRFREEEESEGSVRFREEEATGEINERFNQDLEKYKKGETKSGSIFFLGRPLQILQSAGLNDTEIFMTQRVLRSHLQKHGLTIEDIRNLPAALQDPLMVYEWGKKAKSLIVVTQIPRGGERITVAVKLERNGERLEVNEVASVHGKSIERLLSEMNDERSDFGREKLRYVEKKEALEWLNSPVEAPLASRRSANQELTLATKIIKEFKNPTLQEGKIRAEIDNLSERLHTPIHVIRDVNEIKDENPSREKRKRGSKGWFDPQSGEVVVVLANATSQGDVQRTILHETVAHKGLRQMLGRERFEGLCSDVLDMLEGEQQERLLKKYGDKITAGEEYLATLAEADITPSLWQKIKAKIKSMLREMGIDLRLSDNDLKYLLWKSKNRLMEGDGVMEMAGKAVADANMRTLLFRDGGEVIPVRERYERKVKSQPFLIHENQVDELASLKLVQDLIEASGEKIRDWENPYMNATAVAGKIQAEGEVFRGEFFSPVVEILAPLHRVEGAEKVNNYLLAKSGLERNQVFRRRAMEEIQQKAQAGIAATPNRETEILERAAKEIAKLQEKDFGGITALQAELGETPVEDFVLEFEKAHPETGELWKRIKRASDEILGIEHRSGMISRELKDELKGRMKYYLPLRGFQGETAGDVYEYFLAVPTNANDPLRKARGRTSKADDPIATLAQMAEYAISRGNRNILNQQLLALARNHPSDLLSISREWLVNQGTRENPRWVKTAPEMREGMTPQEFARETESFNARMEELEKEGRAVAEGAALETGLRITPRQASQHEIRIREGGKEYLVYVNGNPRLAQALNGELHPGGKVSELKHSDAQQRWRRTLEDTVYRAMHMGGNPGRYFRAMNRQLAANFTTRNPEFVISNLSRDLIFAASTLPVKEGGMYTGEFIRNIPRASGALLRHLRGKADLSRETDRLLQEFILNGGRTGFTALHNLERFKRDTRREIKKLNGRVDPIAGFRLLSRFFGSCNSWAEDLSRFSTYMTSRGEGRSIQRSVSDAKEVTVNFNRKGSGGGWNQSLKTLFLFYNAAMQSLNQFRGMYKKNPKGTAALVGGFTVMGFLVAALNDAAGGDDDERYAFLPDWIRENNLCIPLGDGFITIPLPIELRAFYGIGEMFYQYRAGRREGKDMPLEMLKKLAELTPVDPFGGEQPFTPDVLKPLIQAKENKNFFGRRIYKNSYSPYQPDYLKALPSTNRFLVEAAKSLNEATGGDAGEKGAVDINPALVEHFIESYTGGMGKFINRTGKTLTAGLEAASGGDPHLEVKDVPMVNRFYTEPGENGALWRINREYYKLLDEMKRFQESRRAYRREIKSGDEREKYTGKLRDLMSSPQGERYRIIHSAQREIEGLEKGMELFDDRQTLDRMQGEILRRKKALLEKVQ